MPDYQEDVHPMTPPTSLEDPRRLETMAKEINALLAKQKAVQRERLRSVLSGCDIERIARRHRERYSKGEYHYLTETLIAAIREAISEIADNF